MGIVIENFGKGHASCLSIDVEHECITVKKSLLPRLTDLWSCLAIIRVNGKIMS